MSFEKLLQELDEMSDLQKSAPAADMDGDGDDTDIAAAADDSDDEGNADEGHAEPDGDEGMGGEGDGDGDEEAMSKSFAFKLEDGTEIDAIDGTELVKSLIDRFDSQEATLGKALGGMVELIKSQGTALAEQGSLIKSLQGEVKRLGGEGRGRKAVISVTEKPVSETLAKSEPEGVSGEEFMAKCLSAQTAGRITGLEVSIAEAALNKGVPVRADIVRRVLG